MKARILAAFALAAAVLTSCDTVKIKETHEYTKEALATLDKVVGKYKLVSVEWDGPALDLTGEGISTTDLSKEFMDGETTAEVTFTKNYSMSSDCVIELYAKRFVISVVDGKVIGVAGNMTLDNILFSVSGDGSIVWDPFSIQGVDRSAEDGNDGGYYQIERFKDLDIEFSGNTVMRITGETALYDYGSKVVVYGHLSFVFECISGKGKG